MKKKNDLTLGPGESATVAVLPAGAKVVEKREVVSGHLEVGANDRGEVVVNHPKVEQDERGGHIVFSPAQAENLARILVKNAAIARLGALGDAAANAFARVPFYVPADYRVPRRGEWYVNKLGDVVRCMAKNYSSRARRRVVVRKVGA